MELEMKFKVDRDYQSILELQGFVKGKKKHQIDTYFLNGSMIDGKKTWLRLREDKLRGTFSCDLHRLNSTVSTEEAEISLSGIEDINKMKKIIETLGYNVQCVVDKERQIYKKENVEIALDIVQGLGKFLEVEIIGDETNENIKKLEDTVKKLGLPVREQIKTGYPNLLQQNGFTGQERN